MIPDAEATMAIMVVSSLALVAGRGDPAHYLALAMMQAILAGAILVVAGLSRVGFISDFIPESVLNGFLNGMALIIIMAQMGNIFGIRLTQEEFFPRLWEFYIKIPTAHDLTLSIGLSSLLLLFLVRHRFPKIPEGLLLTVLATFAVLYWNLGERGIELVGSLPPGLPRPQLPNVKFEEILTLIPFSASIALISFVDTMTTGRAFAISDDAPPIDPDQELIALGLANLGSGFCQGFSIGCSQSRTVVNVMYGGRTQMAALFSAGIVALFLLYFTEPLKDIPVVALTAIIIVAAIRLFAIREIIKAWQTQRSSAYISLITTFAVLIARPHDRHTDGGGFRHHLNLASTGQAP
jgi:MFS superfamily sulfate permease-like transporter